MKRKAIEENQVEAVDEKPQLALENLGKRIKDDTSSKSNGETESRSNTDEAAVLKDNSSNENNKSLVKRKVLLKRAKSVKPSSSKSVEDTTLSSIKEMNRFCKVLMESNVTQLKSKMSVIDFVALCKNNKLSDDFDVNTILNSLGHFYARASSTRHVSLGNAMKLILDFTDDAKAVVEHPNYPKDTSLNYAYCLFCKKKGYENNFKTVPTKVREQYQDKNDLLSIECREEAKRKKAEHICDLNIFLEEFGDSLMDEQVKFVKKQIQKLSKNTSSISPFKKEVNKLSAFEFYKLNKQDKYTHLDKNEREEKLLRHFERLDKDKRAIYEEKERSQ